MAGTKQIVIKIGKGGVVDSLYDESLGLDELGDRRIRRASTVEVPEGEQEWEARCAETGELIHKSRSRSECILREIDHFNERLAAGYVPFRDS